jgi:hypothetical protein
MAWCPTKENTPLKKWGSLLAQIENLVGAWLGARKVPSVDS